MMGDLQHYLSPPPPMNAMQIKLTSLPSLPGVESLSYHEIQSDLNELQRLLSPETDVDSSSVDSEDVIDSQYPVKPRRSIKIVEREETLDFDKSDVTITEIEHALFTIKRILASQKDVAKDEDDRDEIEATTNAYINRLETDKENFKERQKAQEHYLRLQQSYLLRAISTLRSYGQQAVVLRLLLKSLRFFRLEKSKNPMGNCDGKQVLLKRSCVTQGDTLVTIGQTQVTTPYGQGTVTHFDAACDIFTVKLSRSESLLYCSAATLLFWLRHTACATSIAGVLRSYQNGTHKRALSFPRIDISDVINEKDDLILNATGDTCVTEEEEAKEVVDEVSEEVTEEEEDEEENDPERILLKNKNKISDSNGEQGFTGHKDPMLPLKLADKTDDKCSSTGEKPVSEREQLKNLLSSAPHLHHRFVRTSSEQQYLCDTNDAHLLRRMCPAVFAPTNNTSSLKRLVRFVFNDRDSTTPSNTSSNDGNKSVTNNFDDSDRNRYELCALTTDFATYHYSHGTHDTQPNAASSDTNNNTVHSSNNTKKRAFQEVSFASGQEHCWEGNVKRLRQGLQALRDEARVLEEERLAAMRGVMKRRFAATQIATQCATQRLHMFTRRHMQRQWQLQQQVQGQPDSATSTATSDPVDSSLNANNSNNSAANHNSHNNVGNSVNSSRSGGRNGRNRSGSLGTQEELQETVSLPEDVETSNNSNNVTATNNAPNGRKRGRDTAETATNVSNKRR